MVARWVTAGSLLLPGHVRRLRSFELLRFLDYGAVLAEHGAQDVVAEGSLNPHVVSDLASDLDEGVQVENGDTLRQSAQNAAAADFLRVLPEGVARDDVGHDARAAVIEAATNAVGPVLCVTHRASGGYPERSKYWVLTDLIALAPVFYALVYQRT